MQHVFISYKNEDLDFAENVISRLEKEGFSTWTDLKIGAGEEWRNAIDLAIKNALALIVIMTPEAKASEYVTYEWAFAWGVGIRVIPIMLRVTELHPRLEALQYLDFTNVKSRPWDKLIEEVKAAASAPLTYSISIPLNSPPFIRQAVASLDSAVFGNRKNAVRTLELAEMPAARTVLKEALKHPLPDVRSASAEALGEIRDPAAVPPLIETLEDPSDDARRAAAKALGEIKDPAAIPPLIKALEDPSFLVRSGAAKALGEIKDPAAIPPLIEALDDDTVNVCSAAAQSLAKIGHLAAIPPLVETLADPSDGVRSAVAKALGEIKDPTAIPPLTETLKDPYDEVRSAGAKALGKIRDPSAVTALIGALEDPSGKVRSEIVRALGKINDPAAVPPLIKILEDHPWEFESATVAKVLGEFKDSRSVSALTKALQSINSDVRSAAARALDEIKWQMYEESDAQPRPDLLG